jgi:hypothetical protein
MTGTLAEELDDAWWYWSMVPSSCAASAVDPRGPVVQKRHRRTLAAIFRHPIAIAWRDVMTLVIALGGEVRSRSGSVRAVSLRDRDLVVHEPHPSGLLPRAMVLRLRRFLLEGGIEPR